MATLDSLLPHAARLAQFPREENARSNLVLRLQLCSDVDVLRALAARFPFQPEVAVLVWRRIAAVEQGNAATLLEAAGIMYSLGMDDDSRQLIEQALKLDDRNIAAWELKAALLPDAAERRAVYEQILKIDPGNRAAVNHLIVMGRPKS